VLIVQAPLPSRGGAEFRIIRWGVKGASAEWNQISLSMEPLYPQNIMERTFPHLREQREKAEKESILNPESKKAQERPNLDSVFKDEALYFEVPYEGGPTGKHLSTFA